MQHFKISAGIKQALVLTAVLSIALFIYLFNDPTVDAEVETQSGYKLPGAGSIFNASTKSPMGAFEHRYAHPVTGVQQKMFFVFWRNNGDKTIFYTYFDPMTNAWGPNTVLQYVENEQVHDVISGYGVEPAVVGDTIFVLLKSGNGNDEEGSINTSSATLSYVIAFDGTTIIPLISYWKKPVLFVNEHVDAMVSAVKDPGRVDRLRFTFSKETGNKNYDLRLFNCLEFDIYCLAIQDVNINVRGPAMVDFSNKQYVFFWRTGSSYNNRIAYFSFPNHESNPITLVNSKGTYFSSQTKITAHYYAKEPPGEKYIYVSWLSREGNLFLSRITESNLLTKFAGAGGSYYGYGKWETCGLSMKTETSPSLFEYDGDLFIMYSDSNDGYKLKYHRVDQYKTSADSNPVCSTT